jgi:hypothetical protein
VKATPATCKKIYTVASGDWCSKIEDAQGISDATLQSLNPWLDASCGGWDILGSVAATHESQMSNLGRISVSGEGEELELVICLVFFSCRKGLCVTDITPKKVQRKKMISEGDHTPRPPYTSYSGVTRVTRCYGAQIELRCPRRRSPF